MFCLLLTSFHMDPTPSVALQPHHPFTAPRFTHLDLLNHPTNGLVVFLIHVVFVVVGSIPSTCYLVALLATGLCPLALSPRCANLVNLCNGGAGLHCRPFSRASSCAAQTRRYISTASYRLPLPGPSSPCFVPRFRVPGAFLKAVANNSSSRNSSSFASRPFYSASGGSIGSRGG